VTTRNPTELEFEPIRGLPEELPEGETLLWQGRPAWGSFAMQAFHLKAIAVYFGLLAVWRAVDLAYDGAPLVQAAAGASWLVLLGAAVGVIAAGFALLAARTTVYTITSRRVVFTIGVALPVTLNIPFRTIHSADLRRHADGTGDIVLSLAPPHQIAFSMLWPHARPWQFRRPQPMLRALPQPAEAAQVLSRALAAAAMVPVTSAPMIAPDAGPAPQTNRGSPASAHPAAA
jgi:hypothetical protein